MNTMQNVHSGPIFEYVASNDVTVNKIITDFM